MIEVVLYLYGLSPRVALKIRKNLRNVMSDQDVSNAGTSDREIDMLRSEVQELRTVISQQINRISEDISALVKVATLSRIYPEENTTYILNKSMPRAGHTYLSMLLKTLYGKQFNYCEFYREKECCRRAPCYKVISQNLNTAPSNKCVFMQKSHDFDLNDQLLGTSRSLKYIIQIRRPIELLKSGFQMMCAIRYSDCERAVRGTGFLDYHGDDTHSALLLSLNFISENGFRLPDDEIAAWIRGQQAYLDGFYTKWVERFLPTIDPDSAILVDYDDLVGLESEATLRRIERTIGTPFSRELAEAKSLVPVTPRKEAFEGDTPFFTELFHRFRSVLVDADQQLSERWGRYLKPL